MITRCVNWRIQCVNWPPPFFTIFFTAIFLLTLQSLARKTRHDSSQGSSPTEAVTPTILFQEKSFSTAKVADLSPLQSFLQLNKTLFNEEPNSPASINQNVIPQTQTHHLELRPHDTNDQENVKGEPDDDSYSNSSDPDRLEIEDREEQDSDGEENGYDMTVTKRSKLDERYENSKPSSPNRSPINRMDTPESNCSDSHIDQETTKLWQQLTRWEITPCF